MTGKLGGQIRKLVVGAGVITRSFSAPCTS